MGAAVALHGSPLPAGLRTELGWLRLLSGMVFLATSVPVPNGPFVADGLRFLRILGRGPPGARELSLITLAALERGGVRPRDWDGALIDQGLEVRDGSMFECQIHLHAYQRALDAGLVEAAKA